MKKKKIQIKHIPTIIWGETSEKLYLYIHGQGGNKEEAEALGKIVCPNGWQVLSFDLPEHGERSAETDKFDPWHVIPELKDIINYAKLKWNTLSLYANSIGAWFGMKSFENEQFERCLFVSPILDMNRVIDNMMKWASVTEKQLEEEKIIPTEFGQSLSWEYLQYARNNPIIRWESPTNILYADKDNMTELYVVNDFAERFKCKLTIMENGEHWFHTPVQLNFLNSWITGNFS